MNIVFWSNYSGQAGATSNLSLISTFISLKYTYKNLIIRTQYNRNFLENMFLSKDYLSTLTLTDTGLDALHHKMINQSIDSEVLTNYTNILVRKRLDLLVGTYGASKKIYEKNFLNTYEDLYGLAKDGYDLVFSDLSAGENEIANKVMDMADLVVVNLNQNKNVLDDFFNSAYYKEHKKTKKFLFIVGFYDKRLKMNINNISRIYGISKQHICTIPYNRNFIDYANDGKTIEFVFNNVNAKATDNTFDMLSSINDCTNKMLNLLGLDSGLKKIAE